MNQELLQKFRRDAYNCIGLGKDAVMDLMDAVLTTRSLSSFAELSMSPLFRRKWSSLYEAIVDCSPNHEELLKLYLKHTNMEQRIVLAGDHTSWPRLDSPTLKDRTFEHGARVIQGKPITLGHGYSTLALIPQNQGSWSLPLLHERITSFDTPLTKAAQQLKLVCNHIQQRPLTLWDSEYGCASFLKLTQDVEADKIMRLRPNRCLWTEPQIELGRRGRPRKHGTKFKLAEKKTQIKPIENQEFEHPVWGQIELKRWKSLHFQQTADQPMDLVLIQRVGHKITDKNIKPIWLACLIDENLSLDDIWNLYEQRFSIEHWNRFVKQRLHWTLPRFSTPKQSESWSHLMPLLTWQLWLARDLVQDNPLPWQKSLSSSFLTPGRVAQGFATILVVIGTPACAPKPRGKSSGLPKGYKKRRKLHYPTVKKRYSPKSKVKKSTA
jgi:hypothetical protein